VAGCAGTVWLLAPRGVPGRGWGVLWLLPLFVVRPAPLPEGAFRLTVLDVGQGLSAIVETRHYAMVYDTGPRFTEASDAGGRIIAPFMRASGLRRADGLIVSHQDLDHSGGALSLMQTTPIGWFASSLPVAHPIVVRAQASATPIACMAGQQWSWDGVRFTMLHPTSDEYQDAYAKTNDRSCVVRIDSRFGSALLTGDIEAKTEAVLLRTRPALLRADVLLVPHHGSRTSSTHAFVRAVAPAIAVVGCGYRNRFGHPRPDIVARYTNSGIRVVRTDLEGAVTLTFAADAVLVPSSARAERARYWLDAPVASLPSIE
jgi:competence protein ComEC